jgi:SseB protein C-terminal domain
VLKRLFGTKTTPYKAIQTPTSEIVLMGEPSGSGLQVLQAELAKILRGEGNTRKAYLSRIRYATEDRVRVAMLIDGRASASQMAAIIARECQPLVPIDILFLESLSDEHKEKIKQMKPFYVAD